MSTHSPRPTTRRLARPALAGLALAAGLTGVLTAGSPSASAAPDPTTNPAFGSGAYLVRDTAPGYGSGAAWTSPARTDAAVAGGRAFYSAADGSHGQELWVTDGTRAGTRMVEDLTVGPAGSSPDQFVAMGGKVYFTATTASGDELWVTDGTTTGTRQLRDVGGPGVSGNPRDLTAVGGRLWFSAETSLVDNSPSGRELFTSDGTSVGTRFVRDISPGSASSAPTQFTALPGGRVAFFAAGSGSNTELWASNGTASGTEVVRDLNGTPQPSVSDRLVRLPDGALLFVGNDGATGRGLWRTDGTAAGTVQVDGSFAAPADPKQLTLVGDEVVFSGLKAATGYELFRSDGTKAGTQLAADLLSGTESANPDRLGAAGGAVWFQASTATGRTELWSYRPGTPAAMRGVLATDGQGSFLSGIANVNGRPFFSANPTGAGQGVELFTADAGGVRLVADLDGAQSSSPSLPIALGATALYTASSDDLGRELFAYNTQPTTSRLVANRRYSARQAARRTIRVRVTVKGGSLPVSGPVQVRDGARVVGSGRVVKGAGTVRITRRLSPGGHRLSVRFGGGTNGRSSTSRVVRVTVLRAG